MPLGITHIYEQNALANLDGHYYMTHRFLKVKQTKSFAFSAGIYDTTSRHGMALYLYFHTQYAFFFQYNLGHLN